MHCDRQESDRPLYGHLAESTDFPGHFPGQFQISFSVDLRHVGALMPTNDLGRFDSELLPDFRGRRMPQSVRRPFFDREFLTGSMNCPTVTASEVTILRCSLW